MLIVVKNSREASIRGSPTWRCLNSFPSSGIVSDLDRIDLPGGSNWIRRLIRPLSCLRLIPGTAWKAWMIPLGKNARDFWLITAGLTCALAVWLALQAQGPSLEQQIAGIRATAAKNRAMLAEYTWQEQETTSVKGKVQNQRLFEAQLGPDGRIRRTAMDLPEGNLSQTEKAGGMHEWITQKKQHAAMLSAQEVKEIAEAYAQVDPESLRRAYERGDIAEGPNPAADGIKKLSIHNYVKAGDLATLAFNQKDNEIQTLEASSYLADPKESVHILTEFVNTRDGLNHVDAITATVPKKSLSMVIRNLTYEHTFQHVPH